MISPKKVLKEALMLSGRHFPSLILPMMLCSLPVLIISTFGRPGIDSALIAISFEALATMGAHRALLKLGIDKPSFTNTLSEGARYWWRGFKVAFLARFYFTMLFFFGAMLNAPGVFTLKEHPFIGICLLVISGSVTLYSFFWLAVRSFLASPAMADEGTRAPVAYDKGWLLGKQHAKEITQIILALFGIAAASVGLVFAIVALLIAIIGLTNGTVVIITTLLMYVLYWLFMAYLNVCSNVAYLSAKNAMPAANAS